MSPRTIYALSTVLGKSAIAVIRLSGPECRDVIEAMIGVEEGLKILPRQAKLVAIKCPDSGEVLDKALCLFFAGPQSFTGEDMLEFSLHGSIAVVRDVLAALAKMPFLRLAEPGEFSKLAFLNGKLDLTEIEGLGELIDAETSRQRRVAMAQSSGQLRELYALWRDKFLEILAFLEAHLNFPDEAIPEAVIQEAVTQAQVLQQLISGALAHSEVQQDLLRGVKIAVVGVPNSGKSSLVNLITRQDMAIVSDIAGTTRDVLRANAEIAGQAVIIFDTAGLRNSPDLLEAEGIRRAKDVAGRADILLWVVDVGSYGNLAEVQEQVDFMQEELRNLLEGGRDVTLLVLLNKLDLYPGWQKNLLEESRFEEFIQNDEFYQELLSYFAQLLSHGWAQENIGFQWLKVAKFTLNSGEKHVINCKSEENSLLPIIPISAATGAGLNRLIKQISEIIEIKSASIDANSAIITNMRQKALLRRCLSHLEEFLASVACGNPLEMAVFAIYSAVNSLEELLGTVGSEAILDRIFSSFCIGK